MAGILVIISSPSGGGKNTVMRELLKKIPNSAQLVTTTTREKRKGERDGIDYHFLDKAVFAEKLKAGDFVEHNDYAGNWYGTQKVHLDTALAKYSMVFSQADVNGKKSLDKLGIPHLSVFLLPESMDSLKNRIMHRGGVSEESLAQRLTIAHDEIEMAKSYDLSLVNKDGALAEVVQAVYDFLAPRIARRA